jgi:hypothetical protein
MRYSSSSANPPTMRHSPRKSRPSGLHAQDPHALRSSRRGILLCFHRAESYVFYIYTNPNFNTYHYANTCHCDCDPKIEYNKSSSCNFYRLLLRIIIRHLLHYHIIHHSVRWRGGINVILYGCIWADGIYRRHWCSGSNVKFDEQG